MERLSLVTVLLLVFAAIGAWRRDLAYAGVLERKEINNAGSRGAVCNDFSHAIYYMKSSPGSSKWVIYLEGGGGCSTSAECNQRWIGQGGRNRPLMSSLGYPESVTGEDILSSNRTRNPVFHNHTHVLVPYCSSDAWLADRSNPAFDAQLEFRFNSSRDADNFVYRGRSIFRAVIEDLLSLGLSDASEVVLAGSSAGGIGILNNVQYLNETLGSSMTPQRNNPPDMLLIIDSAWFIPFENHHVMNFTREAALSLKITNPACLDMTLGFPCCTSPSCLFARGYLPSDLPPTFTSSSVYDIFTLQESLRETISRDDDDQTLLRLFNGYGALLRRSLMQSHRTHRSLSVYAPSCSQHVYLATSSLWRPDGYLNATQDGSFQEGAFVLRNPVHSGNWERVEVGVANGARLTLRDAISGWYRSPSSQVFFDDGCSGPVCGTCPDTISLEPVRSIWSMGINVLVLIVSALFIVVPISIKLASYLYMKYMLYRQKMYVYNVKCVVKNRPRFPKATHAVNVSCTQLSYGIDFINKPPTTSGADDYPQSVSDCQLHAKVDTFTPCCKSLCSHCLPKLKPKAFESTQYYSNHCCSNHNGLRSDSGIASNSRSVLNPSLGSMAESGDSETSSIADSKSDLATNISKKTILRKVNMYVNPGELVAVMGPSGSGKTTLLDVVLGRRTTGSTEGHIYINGVSLCKMRSWFVQNTGYVRQLATSFYNELTVRENLLFSMNMQAPQGMQLGQKLERVEQVIRETGLQGQADLKVGDGIGLGLSGGQRKRLAIAVQLLSMPNIIFLDEPTSGLDSASSLEILKSLQALAETGRGIVVTIHQPRSEIFLAFDKILLLCNGQVAFFGAPVRVWGFFMRALDNVEEKFMVSEETSSNQADAILDLLKERKSQGKVLQAYEGSGEPKRVRSAVKESKNDTDTPPPPLYSRYPGFWHRLVSLEARASIRQTVFSIIYLPIVYVIFGTILGTTYLFTDNAIQVMSVTCLLSCSSSLFMSSIVVSLLVEPLKLFKLEHSDGIACPHELIIQVFVRMSAVSTLPLTVCATLVFGLVYKNYDLEVYLIILLAFLLVNQAWISLFIVLVVSYPEQAHRLCPVFAAAGGFTCGFIIPKPLMPHYYRWIFYVNPSWYAYSATTVVALNGRDMECSRESPLECFRESGVVVLDQFGLGGVNPLENLVVLMAMVVIFVVLAVVILQLKLAMPAISGSVKRGLYNAAKWRRQRRRIHSWDTLKDNVYPSPAAPNGVVRINMRPMDSVDEPDTPGMRLSKGERLGSHHFLEQPEHELFFNFPWERLQLDEIDGAMYSPIPRSPRVHYKLPKTPSEREASGTVSEVDGHVMSPALLSNFPSEAIDMEEERTEEARRRAVELKWAQRRQKMERELLRLRHYSRSVAQARMRHSVSLGDTLSEEDILRVHSSVSGITRLHQLQRKTYARSMSVPAADPSRLTNIPTLEVFDEEDEVFEEPDTGFFPLPPNDIPTYESTEQLDRLDVSEVPTEEVDAEGWGSIHEETI